MSQIPSTQSDKELFRLRIRTVEVYMPGKPNGKTTAVLTDKQYAKLQHLIAEETNTARIDELEQAHLINHFTSWGGAQGECYPKEYIDERLATLKANKGDKR